LPQAASKSGLEKVKYDAQILLKAAANRCSRKQVLENMAKELAQVIVEQVRSPGVVEPLYCKCKCIVCTHALSRLRSSASMGDGCDSMGMAG
jgi:hypothetical protein